MAISSFSFLSFSFFKGGGGGTSVDFITKDAKNLVSECSPGNLQLNSHLNPPCLWVLLLILRYEETTGSYMDEYGYEIQ